MICIKIEFQIYVLFLVPTYLMAPVVSFIQNKVVHTSQLKFFPNLNFPLKLSSPYKKTHDLFWPNYPKSHFFVDQGGAILRDLLKIRHGFLCVEREGVIFFLNFEQ